MTYSFKIGSKSIGRDHPPFLIAEMSGNHNQSLEKAIAIVDAAAEVGADAIKLQTYTADTLTLDVAGKGFLIEDPKSPWLGRSLHDLYSEASTPREWHGPIFKRAAERGLACFSSPFDETAVDFLETLNVPAYKIASFEITHLPLIRKAAATGKPLILSTGMANIDEIEEAVTAARGAGCRQLCLLKCTSTYPASPANSNVRTVELLRSTFHCESGLSDHTRGLGVAIAAIACGASIIEKHFTLDRAEGGVDSSFSLEPSEFSSLVSEARRAWESLGAPFLGPTAEETPSLAFRRSIYVSQAIHPGDTISAEQLKIVRPGYGLHPRHLDALLGKTAKRAAVRGEPAAWDLIE